MRVFDVMTPSVELIHPDNTIQDAALKMAEGDLGLLPVAENGQLVGMLTDRDIVVRGIAQDCNPSETTVREVMTERIRYCFDDESADDAAAVMGHLQIRRMPVVDRERRLVGMVSIADIARKHDRAKAGEALEEVCAPASAVGATDGASARRDGPA
jgi:CBS domain-containing protein